MQGRLFVLIALCATAAACKNSTSPSAPKAKFVVASPDSIRVGVGATQQLTAIVLDADSQQITGATVGFSTTSSTITVSPSGLVTGIAAGSGRVFVTSGAAMDTVPVFVEQYSLVVAPDSITLAAGSAAQIDAIVINQDSVQVVGAGITFTAGAGVTVTSTGLVTAVDTGLTTVTVKSGALSTVVPVYVYEGYPSVITNVTTLSAWGVDVSSAGKVYTTHPPVDSISALSSNRTLVTTFGSGDRPDAVKFTPSGAKAYATYLNAGTIGEIDANTNTQVQEIPVGGQPYVLAISADGAMAYVTRSDNKIVFVNTTTNTAVDSMTLPVASNNGIAINPANSQLIYVSSNTGGVREINVSTKSVTRTFNIAGNLQNVAVTPDGKELWVANEGSNVSRVTLSTGAISSVPNSGGGFGLALSRGGRYVYVSNSASGDVMVIDRIAMSVLTTWAVGGSPRHIATVPNSAEVVIANEGGFVTFVH